MEDTPKLSQKTLQGIITYSAKTGEFVWKKRRWCVEGSTAGYVCRTHGYRIIEINGKNYTGARLAWLYTYGYFPREQVDHTNHNRSDNRIVNLREVTNQENQMNRRFTGNSSGFRGVYWDKARGLWSPKIKFNQRVINLGRYKDISEAIGVRLTAECEYGFHYNHGQVLTK